MKSCICTMKSLLCSDEIFGKLPKVKLNPKKPCEARFHHEVISYHNSDIYSVITDLIEKTPCLVRQSVFSGSPKGN